MNAKGLTYGFGVVLVVTLLLFAGKAYLDNREIKQQAAALEAAREAEREAALQATIDARRGELRAGAIAWADWLAGQSASGYALAEFADQFKGHLAPFDMLVETDQNSLTNPQLKALLALAQANGRLQRLLFDVSPGIEDTATKWRLDVNHARDDCREAVQVFLDTLP